MSKFLAFVSGAAVGATATWYILKEKMRRERDAETEALREAMASARDENKNEEYQAPKSVEVCEKPELKEFVERIQKAGYVDYSSLAAEAKKAAEAQTVEEVAEMKPYVITPDDFASREGYDIQSLTYYTDGVLTDVNDIPVENVDDIVGEESLTHFGEFEEDSVYVRNERLGVDYEILLDSRTYEQKIHPKPDTED